MRDKMLTALYTALCLAAIGSTVMSNPFTRSFFYDYLPSEMNSTKPSSIEIRSTFTGEVTVISSPQFGLFVNVSSRSTLELSGVETQYTALGNSLIVQLSNSPVKVGEESRGLLITGGIVFGTILTVIIVITSAYLCFWAAKYETEEPDVTEEDKYREEADKEMREFNKLQSVPTPNGNVLGRQLYSELSAPASETEHSVHMKSGNYAPHRRKRHSSRNDRRASSSEDISSVDENWNMRKAQWRKQQVQSAIPEQLPSQRSNQLSVPNRTAINTVSASTALHGATHHTKSNQQFSDIDGTSADAGFSSCNEFSSSRHKISSSRLTSKHNSSMEEELEWDGFDVKSDKSLTPLPPPDQLLADMWQCDGSYDEEMPWPPPMEDTLEEDHHTEMVEDNLHDLLRPSDSDADVPAASETENLEQADVSDSPLDDGYETGAVNSQPPQYPGGASTSSKSHTSGKLTQPSKLSYTVLVSICVLSLASCVCAVAMNYDPTQASIVIFVPEKYVQEINIFVNDSDKIVFDTARKPRDMNVRLFEASNPIMTDLSVQKCDSSKNCQHGCNRKTGLCVCNKGFVLYEGTKCTDKSDCLYLPCLPSEVCHNTVGGYTCECGKNYWRDESGKCVKCASSSCPAGWFEKQRCPSRVCLPCDQTCPNNQYMTKPCTPHRNIQCKHCRAACTEDEFEYRPCSQTKDRLCKPLLRLPEAKGSRNVILDSRADRKDVVSMNWLQDKNTTRNRVFNDVELRRGNLLIKVALRAVNLYPLMQAVIHADSNDNEEFASTNPPESIIKQFCPYPLPVKYELLRVQHSNVTVAKQCPDCSVEPRKPCQTYKQFGRSPPLHPFNTSLVCAEPEALTDMFNLNDFLSNSRSINVQPSRSCALLHDECSQCAHRCAQGIVSATTGNCSITGGSADGGWSPRLMYCQNCCMSRQCDGVCVSAKQCRPQSCWNGNLVEFLLTASFPTQSLGFGCHVELAKNKPLFYIEYSVFYKNKLLANSSILLKQNVSTVTGRSHSDGILSVDYSTTLTSIPNIISGELASDSLGLALTSGNWMPEGRALDDSVDLSSRLHILPAQPFSLSTKWWSE